LNLLTWHDGRIPSDEIWIKLGGDKGGSFKASFQIVNVEHPNSVHNTCVFTVFQAPGSVFNLHVAFDRCIEQVDDLQKSQWSGKNLLVFMSGDYDFLCKMYGLSGASGKHRCLWCNIANKDLKLDVVCPTRTLETLKDDHERFRASGGNPEG
jgi:hypothetical protein